MRSVFRRDSDRGLGIKTTRMCSVRSVGCILQPDKKSLNDKCASHAQICGLLFGQFRMTLNILVDMERDDHAEAADICRKLLVAEPIYWLMNWECEPTNYSWVKAAYGRWHGLDTRNRRTIQWEIMWEACVKFRHVKTNDLNMLSWKMHVVSLYLL